MTTAFDTDRHTEVRALAYAQTHQAHRDRRAALLALHESGATLAELAELHGTSKQSICNMLAKARRERA